ncbi:ATP-dependent helicase [Microlunatus ginsengisoli]|uniref:ATP-dependent helicase n=1 Tax=Microlunatus ginsengisoli TaxID=363863 RepID=A0ABP7AXQ2_9ACTN
MERMSSADPLEVFSPATSTWFREVFAAPTAAQRGAWQTVAAGENALVIAPTGSGKTLAAFLWALDDLTRSGPVPSKQRCRVLYVSPLKALAVDVERNLRAPLAGITQTALRIGQTPPTITVGVRSGDTSAADRRAIASRPPDILITTPESLFLMLSSAARDSLRYVRTVIVDEVHALAGTKRGAHLALSLERLAALTAETAAEQGAEPAPIQRIGLSATVRPPERVARFLGGPDPVRVISPPAEKSWDLEVVVPVEDMSELGATASVPTPSLDDDGPPASRPSIWPHVENKILDLIEAHRSTIVFANSRRLAERITAHLNELHAERVGEAAEEFDPPAEIMAQSGASAGLDGTRTAVIARAHHGSVSKEQRAQIEADLKSGQLPCVVATSSLELGIDMGAVDVVVQVEAPPSVASGLQRVGRAGHQVGATSRGVFFPKHRGDLVESAVVVERMRAGAIEEVAELRNPLDVLAQQLVAAVAVEEWSADDLYALCRRAAPYADLPRSAYDAVLDMLSGRYPSEDFAELRPRVVWQRDTGAITARPGAQRLAVTSGGTIPDRGLFGVFLVGEGTASGKHSPGRRVGELDEEMVYETRVGDVFTLGTTSWRVEQITHDQVLVSPAPGSPGRLPFWKGDSPARPVELGVAFGEFVRTLAALPPDRARDRLAEAGLDPFAAANLVSYLGEQAALGALPTDQTIVFERFRDELGDWRVCVHSPLGAGVLAPWSLAIERSARERYGMEVQATATNDGIVLRIPDTETHPPSAELLVVDPDELEAIVTEEVGASALFAARFRECAARALLLPRRDPRSRTPLWQQRMRSAQLLSVAARYPEFPIVLETMRECLSDVFDLDGLLDLQRRIAARSVSLVEVETTEPSPFAKSLLFGYVGAFVYEGDVPLAERKAAALALDATLLAELLGKDGLKQLLDPSVIAATEADLQGLSTERQATSTEQLFDLIRTAGPFSRTELALRSGPELPLGPALDTLLRARRLVEVRIGGVDMIAVVEDVPRLRDGLGIPVPPGVAADFDTPAAHPIEDLVLRWARTHGPFAPSVVARRYGLGRSVVEATCEALTAAGTLTAGEFVDTVPGIDAVPGAELGHRQYCHSKILALIKRRTLAALRKEVEPVEQLAYARFLPAWQGIGGKNRGADAVLGVIEQLAGYPLPASSIESVVLPARVNDYQPAMLDELLSSGEVRWVGDGPISDGDGWIRLYPAEIEPPPARSLPASYRGNELLAALGGGGAHFFDGLLPSGLAAADRSEYVTALWDLVWCGLVSSDTFAPVRQFTTGGTLRRPPRAASRSHRSRPALRAARAPRISSPTTVGRWSLVERNPVSEAERLAADVFAQLDRYGLVTRGSVLTENPSGGFGPAYRALSRLEEGGQCRRGYFVEGLGAAQFALPGAVDRLRRAIQPAAEPVPLVLAATEPANPYGAALPWPDREGHRPGRKAGALVVLVDGALTFYVERGGRTLLSFTDDAAVLGPAAESLAQAVTRGLLGKLTVERADGEHVFDSAPVSHALQGAGFKMTPQGLRLRPPATLS